MSHLPSASLGHYAPLSFVAIGRNQRPEFRISNLGFRIADLGSEMWNTVYRSPFTVYDCNDFCDSNGFNGFNYFNDL